MPDRFTDLINQLPFFLATVGKVQVHTQRIIEAIIIAAITAGVTVYTGQAVLEERSASADKRIEVIAQETKEIRQDMRQMWRQIDTHSHQ